MSLMLGRGAPGPGRRLAGCGLGRVLGIVSQSDIPKVRNFFQGLRVGQATVSPQRYNPYPLNAYACTDFCTPYAVLSL